MRYEFKLLEEAGWAVLVAVVVFLGQVASTTDPTAVTNWRALGVSVLAGAIRAGGGALLSWWNANEKEVISTAPQGGGSPPQAPPSGPAVPPGGAG